MTADTVLRPRPQAMGPTSSPGARARCGETSDHLPAGRAGHPARALRPLRQNRRVTPRIGPSSPNFVSIPPISFSTARWRQPPCTDQRSLNW